MRPPTNLRHELLILAGSSERPASGKQEHQGQRGCQQRRGQHRVDQCTKRRARYEPYGCPLDQAPIDAAPLRVGGCSDYAGEQEAEAGGRLGDPQLIPQQVRQDRSHDHPADPDGPDE